MGNTKLVGFGTWKFLETKATRIPKYTGTVLGDVLMGNRLELEIW